MFISYFRTILIPGALACIAAVSLAQTPTCCADKPPIRPIDKTCLPAGNRGEVPLYHTDLLLKYQEIANIDSFKSDNNCSDTVRMQLKDLQAKGRIAGADALIRVRLLANHVRGFQENPDTPFFSVKQGTSNDLFYRATAVKYLEAPPREVEGLNVDLETAPLAGKTKSGDMFGTDKLFQKKKKKSSNATVPEVLSTNPRSY